MKQSDSIPCLPGIIKYEYRTEKLRRHAPRLINQPDNQYRYRSLYGYGPDTVDSIQSRGNTRELTGQPVFSDCLIIDCDTDEEVVEVRNRLLELNVCYEEWTTGNRGRHFHLPIKPMWGTDTIWSQVRWLREVGLWNTIDTSIYREGGQIRVPGASHEKTGRHKELKEVVAPTPNWLEIPIHKTPPLPTPSLQHIEGTSGARNEYHRNLLYHRTEGGRHTHMFVLWNRGRSAGYDPEIIKDDIRWWNVNMASPPHPDHVVETKLRGFR